MFFMARKLNRTTITVTFQVNNYLHQPAQK